MKKAIYKITNLINGKVYIGQSIHPNKRWLEHCTQAHSKNDNFPIHLAINKYGKENFTFEILEWCDNYDEREKELIAYYHSLLPNGYNVLDGSSHNPVMYGEDHPRNTLSNIQVQHIITELQLNQLSDIEIAKKYNTTAKIVADINHGITHIQSNISYPIRIRKGRTGGIDINIRLNIINDLKYTNLSYTQLAQKYNVSKGMIGHINYGRYNPIEDIDYPIRRYKNTNAIQE